MPTKVDLNTTIMRKREPIGIVIAVVFLSQFVINTREAWIIEK
jgi:hypothetical protein